MNGTAIEFESRVEGGVIRIPEAYRDVLARVKAPVYVVLREHRQSKTLSRKNTRRVSTEDVLAPCITTSGWKFSREEAHER